MTVERYRIPHTEIDVFPLNLGANTFGWTSDELTSHAVLDAYTERGGNFVDTADMYSYWADGNEGGESEAILGRWMRAKGNRQDVVVATKVGGLPTRKGLRRENVVAALNDSLRRLQTDYVDLYYGHYDDEQVSIEEQVETFDALVRAGKVRALALSNYTPERLREWFAVARSTGAAIPVALQPRYNLVSRSYEEHYAPIVAAENLAVFPWASLAAGFLTGKYRSREDIKGASRAPAVGTYMTDQSLAVVGELIAVADGLGAAPATVALAWLRAKGMVPLASASRPDQLAVLFAAVELSLGATEVERLDKVSKGL